MPAEQLFPRKDKDPWEGWDQAEPPSPFPLFLSASLDKLLSSPEANPRLGGSSSAGGGRSGGRSTRKPQGTGDTGPSSFKAGEGPSVLRIIYYQLMTSHPSQLSAEEWPQLQGLRPWGKGQELGDFPPTPGYHEDNTYNQNTLLCPQQGHFRIRWFLCSSTGLNHSCPGQPANGVPASNPHPKGKVAWGAPDGRG